MAEKEEIIGYTSPYTPALARLLARPLLINRSYELDFTACFTSLLLAFLASDAPLLHQF